MSSFFYRRGPSGTATNSTSRRSLTTSLCWMPKQFWQLSRVKFSCRRRKKIGRRNVTRVPSCKLCKIRTTSPSTIPSSRAIPFVRWWTSTVPVLRRLRPRLRSSVLGVMNRDVKNQTPPRYPNDSSHLQKGTYIYVNYFSRATLSVSRHLI